MPELSVIIPTPDADRSFAWEPKLRDSPVEAELLVRDEGSASAARNAGIRAASADKLVFLDDDSVPRGNYFERVAALLEDYPAVTGRIRDTGASYIRPVSSGDYDQGESGHVTETVVGCNMAMRREVVETIGGFDERLPYGHEETELVDRLCEQYDVWYCPDLVVDHPFADSPFTSMPHFTPSLRTSISGMSSLWSSASSGLSGPRPRTSRLNWYLS